RGLLLPTTRRARHPRQRRSTSLGIVTKSCPYIPNRPYAPRKQWPEHDHDQHTDYDYAAEHSNRLPIRAEQRRRHSADRTRYTRHPAPKVRTLLHSLFDFFRNLSHNQRHLRFLRGYRRRNHWRIGHRRIIDLRRTHVFKCFPQFLRDIHTNSAGPVWSQIRLHSTILNNCTVAGPDPIEEQCTFFLSAFTQACRFHPLHKRCPRFRNLPVLVMLHPACAFNRAGIPVERNSCAKLRFSQWHALERLTDLLRIILQRPHEYIDAVLH